VIVLDSFGVVAAFLGEPAASEVAALLRSQRRVTLTPLGVAEVVDRLVRIAGADSDEVVLDLAELGLADPDPLDAAVAIRAGILRARRYHRTRCAVSLADCVAAEVAREHGAALATSDPHLLDVCAAEAIEVLVLPDSQGERWESAG
jgi:predicted nucleic acid-binding protein